MSYPRWINKASNTNLREVGPGLYVGALDSPLQSANTCPPWAAVINLANANRHLGDWDGHYSRVPVVLHWTFSDGLGMPHGLLEAVEAIVRGNIKKGPVLIHCHAGLSRSASAAYAMLRVIWGLDHLGAYNHVYAQSPYPMPETLASARKWVGARRLVD